MKRQVAVIGLAGNWSMALLSRMSGQLPTAILAGTRTYGPEPIGRDWPGTGYPRDLATQSNFAGRYITDTCLAKRDEYVPITLRQIAVIG